MSDEKVMSAIRELRAATGLNQIEFAVKMGKSYPSIQRYERIRPPAGIELVPFVYMAREFERADLAEIFKSAVVDSIPEPVMRLVREPQDVRTTPTEAGRESAINKRRVRAR